MISIRSKFIIGVAVLLAAPSVLAEERDCLAGASGYRYGKPGCPPKVVEAASVAGAQKIRANETLSAKEQYEQLDNLMERFEAQRSLTGKSKEERRKDPDWVKIEAELDSATERYKGELRLRLSENHRKLGEIGKELGAISSVLTLVDEGGEALSKLPTNLRSLVTLVATSGQVAHPELRQRVEAAKEQLATVIDARHIERDRLLKLVIEDTDVSLAVHQRQFPQAGSRSPAIERVDIITRSTSARSDRP